MASTTNPNPIPDSYIIDPFGQGWTIATHVEDVEPAQLMRRMTEMQGV
jgi:PhnB protein